MNRVQLIAILLLLHSSSFAQKNIFIHPYLGVGTTGVTGYADIRQRNMFRQMQSATAGISIGRYFGNFRVDVGAGLLTTGYKHKNIMVSSLAGPGTDSADMTVRHTHVLLPITAGYTFAKGNDFTITPSIGLAPVYNAHSQSTWKYYSTGEETKYIFTNTPGNPFAAFSLIGTASVSLAYHFNEHLAVTLTPTGYFTITPMMQNAFSSQHNYAITGNVGLLVSL